MLDTRRATKRDYSPCPDLAFWLWVTKITERSLGTVVAAALRVGGEERGGRGRTLIKALLQSVHILQSLFHLVVKVKFVSELN
jgi:hypothetical protein